MIISNRLFLYLYLKQSRAFWNETLKNENKNNTVKCKNSLAFSIVPTEFEAAVTDDDDGDDDDEEDPDVWILSLDTQQLHIMPPLHKSTGLPPSSTHEMLRPQSNLLLLYQQVWGITVYGGKKRL